MSRRAFLKSLTAPIDGLALPAVTTASRHNETWKTRQTPPLAEFQNHNGKTLCPPLASDQQLMLIRKTDNRYDDCAVPIDWQLSGTPRLDNAAAAQLQDRTMIAQLTQSCNPLSGVKKEVRWLM